MRKILRRSSRPPWPLTWQLLLALGGSVLVVGLIVGKLVKQLESDYLTRSLEQQNHKVAQMLSVTAIDAVISEDLPVLQTIVSEAVEKDPDILLLIVENERRETLAEWSSPASSSARSMSLSEDLNYAGELFGRIQITWDIQDLTEEVSRHVRHMQVSRSPCWLF